MATREDFLKWYERDLKGWGDMETHTLVRPILMPPTAASPSVPGMKISFFTDTNQYHLTVVERPGEDGYLGCAATSRKPRAGEDWARGNDLPDGPLTEETWHRILAAIVAYEMVRVHKREHTSDCAVHNAPAFPAGPCDCEPPQPPAGVAA